MTDSRIKTQILDIIFGQVPKNDCVVFLFGSHATGDAIHSSDIDIGLLAKKSVPSRAFVEIQEQLNNDISTLQKIDIIDFSSVNEKIKTEALKEIKIWHEGKNCRGLLKNLKRD